MQMKVNIFFDKRNAPKDHAYLKFSLYKTGKTEQCATGLCLTIEECKFLKSYASGITGHVKDALKIRLWETVYGKEGLLAKANATLEILGADYSLQKFRALMKDPHQEANETIKEPDVQNDLISWLMKRHHQLFTKKQFGTADLLKASASSLSRFLEYLGGERPLTFEEVDVEFLKDYETWMMSIGKNGKPCAVTTLAIYLRNIMTCFNEAIKAKIIIKDCYPFGEELYRIPSGVNAKRSLDKETLSYLRDAECFSEQEEFSRDLFFLSYYCNGANLSDILRWKWSDMNLSEKHVSFFRKKTIRTKRRDIKQIRVELLPEAIAIIKRWCVPFSEEGFVFGVLNKNMGELQMEKSSSALIVKVNRYMKKLCERLGAEEVTSYFARHSFAVTLELNGTPVSAISEMLGHSDLKTTQNYLGGFKVAETRGFMQSLI